MHRDAGDQNQERAQGRGFENVNNLVPATSQAARGVHAEDRKDLMPDDQQNGKRNKVLNFYAQLQKFRQGDGSVLRNHHCRQAEGEHHYGQVEQLHRIQQNLPPKMAHRATPLERAMF